MKRTRLRQWRAVVVAGVIATAAFIAGVSTARDDDAPAAPASKAEEAGPPELPLGGRSLLPEYRLVGFYGAPQDEALGALGIGDPADAAARLEEQAAEYEGGKPVQLVFELLATIAADSPGEDGLYVNRQPHRVIGRYLEEARKHDAILLLDIQPGRADFADEVRRLSRWLREPDVGLALDPEWHVSDTEVPGQVIGSVSSFEVNQISERLATTVAENELPEKLFVIHQFTEEMITTPELLEPREGLATVLNVDGFGDIANKTSKYEALHPGTRSGFYAGFKLFYEEDLGLMTPSDVNALRPKPNLIVYE